jgi:ferredoxin-NADP reductase
VSDTPTPTAPTRRIKRGWMNLRVDRIVDESWDTKTFYLVDADEGGRPFDYVAGQYLTFRFDDVAEKPLVRSYTMSSSPVEEGYSAFTVKRVEGGKISNWLCDTMKVGSVLRARGPIGKFVYDPKTDHGHLIMVAGGSGVTPFVSIMREYQDKLGREGAPQRMTLLVSYRSTQDLICWQALEAIRKVKGCEVFVTLSREDKTADGFWHGRIDDTQLAKAIGGAYQTATFMTCGPTAIMDHAAAHWRAAGVPDGHIKMESFES